jgi:hypothetical protein
VVRDLARDIADVAYLTSQDRLACVLAMHGLINGPARTARVSWACPLPEANRGPAISSGSAIAH